MRQKGLFLRCKNEETVHFELNFFKDKTLENLRFFSIFKRIGNKITSFE